MASIHFATNSIPTPPAQPLALAAHKRKLDQTENCRESKKVKYDLIPLFTKILSALNPANGDPLDLNDADMLSITHMEAVEQLSMDHEVLSLMQQVSLKKIKEIFREYLKKSEQNQPYRKRVHSILKDLYPIALFNSGIPAQLTQIAEELPALKEKVTPKGILNLHNLMRDGRSLRKQAENCTSAKAAETLIPQIEQHLRALGEFRKLKQYGDKEENTKMLDFSNILTEQRAPKRYREIKTQYIPMTEKLKDHSRDLLSVSLLVGQLNGCMLKLQKFRAQGLMVAVAEENPLETRFLKGFGLPFYNGFARHFWAMLWNSQEDPEVKEIMQQLPNSHKVSWERVSMGFLNEVWERYLPDSDFEGWMVQGLNVLSSEQLNTLESQLQAKAKTINEIHEDSQLTKESKHQMEGPHHKEMEQLCLDAAKPSFTTLSELRTFLTS